MRALLIRVAGLALTLALALALPLNVAHAGRSCEQSRLDPTTFAKAMTLAENTRAALEASGAQVALLARAGQDLSSYGLHYSHLAFAWRDHPKGRWLVMHELNQCGTAQSALFDQGLGNFFLDDMFEYKSVILVPGAQGQARLAAALGSKLAARMHEARYNMLAYPFSVRHQNSNQWVLEAYAASQSESTIESENKSESLSAIESRGKAQAWLKFAGYKPGRVWVPTAKRLGARLFRANVDFDDHPLAMRMTGQIDTVTVESVLQFVRRHDREAALIVVGLENR